jgi:hypothetical protein
MGNLKGYEWVTRHTWQSWREHYKKNQAALDAKIKENIRLFPPPETQNGIHRFKRTGKFQVDPAEVVTEIVHYEGNEALPHEEQVDEAELSDDSLPDHVPDSSRKRTNDDQVASPARKRNTAQRKARLPRRIDLQKARKGKGKGKEATGQTTMGAPDFDAEDLFEFDE